MQEIPRLAEELLTSQERHCSNECNRFILRQIRHKDNSELYVEVTASALTQAICNVADT